MKKQSKLKSFHENKIKKALDKIPSSKKGKGAEDKLKGALSDVAKITHDTLPKHREEVLGSARKYIYPLKHSTHHIVRLSVGILIAAVIAFFVFSSLEIYYFKSSSGFIYSISEVVPFPVAKAGPSWVSYHSYLFELRRNMHYYESQQQVDFATSDGKRQLDSLEKQAISQVILNAYVKQLASKNNISVSDAQVNNEITLVRSENRLGNNNEVLESVLKDYWGWTLSDFKTELSQELLQQAVVAKLDTPVIQKANSVYAQLRSGADFSSLANTYSDDASTKGNGGQYSFAITPDTESIAPQITAEIFQLKAGQISSIINTGYSLDIVKVISVSGNNVQAAHIQFNLAPINTYTTPLEKAHPATNYIKV
jgi:hypothetical protein